MSRHFSLDELARLGVDDLKPRNAARLRHHLAACSRCTQLNSQLSAVPAVLSSLECSPIPENLSARIEWALIVDARLRIAREPATEASRRDLAAARPVRLSRGRRLPRLSVAATRTLAAAGAIFLIGAGGYEIASHASPPANTASSSSTAVASPSAAASQAMRARIGYGDGAMVGSGNARQRHCARRQARMFPRIRSRAEAACTSRATSVRRTTSRRTPAQDPRQLPPFPN